MFKCNLPINSIFIPKVFNYVGVHVMEAIIIKRAISRTECTNKGLKKHFIEFLSIDFTTHI